MKNFLSVCVFALFLISLWIYQLPRSPVERRLMVWFSPLQSVFLTDRQYRMYAPDPRSIKDVPSLMLRTAKGKVLFYPGPTRNIFTREKLMNFLDRLAKAYGQESSTFEKEEASEIFFKLAEKICNASLAEDRVLAVTLQTRRVNFEGFREDIVWDEPEVLANLGCGGRGNP
jgi:hypothetical protein